MSTNTDMRDEFASITFNVIQISKLLLFAGKAKLINLKFLTMTSYFQGEVN